MAKSWIGFPAATPRTIRARWTWNQGSDRLQAMSCKIEASWEAIFRGRFVPETLELRTITAQSSGISQPRQFGERKSCKRQGPWIDFRDAPIKSDPDNE
jgi:hypothetical protein